MTDSLVESWDTEVKVRWVIKVTGIANVKTLVIMMYLKKDDQSDAETKGRRKRIGLIWNVRKVDCCTQKKSFCICTHKYVEVSSGRLE